MMMELDFWFDTDAVIMKECDEHGDYVETGYGCPICEYEGEQGKSFFWRRK